MSTFEEDRKKEKRIEAILEYFKLLQFYKLAEQQKDRNGAFELIGGDKLYKKVVNNDEDVLSIYERNLDVMKDLKENLNMISGNKLSTSEIYKDMFKKLDWISNIIDYIEPEETINETIIDFYNNWFRIIPNREVSTNDSKVKELRRTFKEINELTQKRENN